jgi:hypothetical protein
MPSSQFHVTLPDDTSVSPDCLQSVETPPDSSWRYQLLRNQRAEKDRLDTCSFSPQTLIDFGSGRCSAGFRFGQTPLGVGKFCFAT